MSWKLRIAPCSGNQVYAVMGKILCHLIWNQNHKSKKKISNHDFKYFDLKSSASLSICTVVRIGPPTYQVVFLGKQWQYGFRHAKEVPVWHTVFAIPYRPTCGSDIWAVLSQFLVYLSSSFCPYDFVYQCTVPRYQGSYSNVRDINRKWRTVEKQSCQVTFIIYSRRECERRKQLTVSHKVGAMV